MESIKRIRSQILPISLSAAMINWTVSSLSGALGIDVLLLTMILCCLFFIVCNFIEKQKSFKVPIFIVLSIVFFMFCQFASAIGNGILTMFLIAVYGFSSAIYYFTIIRYRVAVIFIIGIIPFLIHSARTDKGITLPFILFIVLFFLVYYERSRKKSNNTAGQGVYNGKWYYWSMVTFLAAILTIAWIAPKPTVIPRLSYLNAVISQTVQPLGVQQQNIFQGINNSVFNPVSLKMQSRIDSLSAPLSDRILFEVEAEEPLYLRIQSWDKYEDNSWKVGSKDLGKYQPIDNFYRSEVKYSVLVQLIEKAKQEGVLLASLSDIEGLWEYPSIPQEKKSAVIVNKNYLSMDLIPIPLGTIDVYKEYDSTENIFMNQYGNCHIGSKSLRAWNKYNIDYISQRLTINSLENKLIKVLNQERVESLLNADTYKEGSTNNDFTISYDNLSVLFQASDDLKAVYKEFTQLPSNISQRIYELAKEITDSKYSDYEKALAIEQYFHNSDFRYSLNPPRIPRGAEGNDYFIFESRRGFCVHYASAMVILARACGLPARYAEGYVADEFDTDTGFYVVRERDAHAFAEIYIAGYGWMSFEPTVSIEEEDGFDIIIAKVRTAVMFVVSGAGRFIDIMPIWVRFLFIPFFFFTLMFLVWMARSVYVDTWKKRMQRIESHRAVCEVFLKITKLLGVVNLGMNKSETPSQYEQRVLNESGVVLSDFIEVFNKSKYAGINPSKEDIRVAIALYKDVVLYIKGRLGRINLLRYFWFV